MPQGEARIAALEQQIAELERKVSYHRTMSRRRQRELAALGESRAAPALPGHTAGQPVPHVEALRQPSFAAQMAMWRRDINRVRRSGDRSDPRFGLNRKLDMYRFAESHGLRVPEVYGVWETPEQIDWAGLPDRVVVKSDRGFSGNGVLPLLRDRDGFRLVGSDLVLPPAELTCRLRTRLDLEELSGPFFAEELMPLDGEALPHDVKVYTFYGEVGHVLVRGLERHADLRTARWRYLAPDGTDLGAVSATNRTDPSLPVPARLAELVEIATRISLAAPLPFARVDLYDLADDVWFGELTLTPGGRQVYTAAHDLRLGVLWETAGTRLQRALRGGRPPTLTPGPHPVRTPAG